jgi:hypothetical protein
MHFGPVFPDGHVRVQVFSSDPFVTMSLVILQCIVVCMIVFNQVSICRHNMCLTTCKVFPHHTVPTVTGHPHHHTVPTVTGHPLNHTVPTVTGQLHHHTVPTVTGHVHNHTVPTITGYQTAMSYQHWRDSAYCL